MTSRGKQHINEVTSNSTTKKVYVFVCACVTFQISVRHDIRIWLGTVRSTQPKFMFAAILQEGEQLNTNMNENMMSAKQKRGNI